MARLRAINTVAARALIFTVLTAARSGEVIGARWEEIDMAAKVWTIPRSRTKAAREHRVPLSEAALAIVLAMPCRSGFIFPGVHAPKMAAVLMWTLLRDTGVDATIHGLKHA
jgi:integrase